jgi:hypothetical protein
MKEPRGTATVSTARRVTADVNHCQFTAVTSKCHRMLDPANVLSYDGILRNGSFLMVFSASRVLRTLENQFYLDKRTHRRVVDYPKVGEVISKSYIILLYLEKADQFLLLKLVPCRMKFFFCLVIKS